MVLLKNSIQFSQFCVGSGIEQTIQFLNFEEI